MNFAFDRAFNLRRRQLLGYVAGAASMCLLKNESAIGQSVTAQDAGTALRERYDNLLLSVLGNQELLEAARGDRERRIVALEMGLDVLQSGLITRLPPSSTPISQRANDLIIQLEISSEQQYTKKYQHPIWPHGNSGVTIGIGYDIGYVSIDFLKEDWEEFIAGDVIEKLSAACNKKGESARDFLPSVRDVEVNWESALNQFQKKTLPLYVAETEAALPNTNLLSPDSMGALVSLVYNRGPSFAASGARYEEMRNIKARMNDKEFSKIPNEFLSMRRIWEDDPNLVGVVKRRELEALLFEQGLGST